MSDEQTAEGLLREIIDLCELACDQLYGGEWTHEEFVADDLNGFVHARLETPEGKEFGVRVSERYVHHT